MRSSVRSSALFVLLLAALLPARARVDVVFEADLRAEIAAGRFDAKRDGVSVRGGLAPLNWGLGLPMKPLGDGRYEARVRFPAPPFGNQPLAHKFRIEKPGQGGDEGWEAGRNRAALLEGPAPRIARLFGAEPPAPPPRITGTVLTVEPPAGAASPPARPVWVWLPPGYDAAPARRYPVLYLLDGQNVFDWRSAGSEWMVDETAQRLVLAGAVQPMIIVAVPSGRDRTDELTPTAGRMDGQRRGGGGPAFARWLLDGLKPAIDARFRTQPETASTAIGGSSFGGLFALWFALHHADRIGAALVVSPSVWWDDGFLLRDASQWTPAPGTQRPRLWLDIGGQEGPGAVPAVQRLRDTLLARGWAAGMQLAYTEAPDAGHDELAWAARVEGMLKFLYPPTHENLQEPRR